MPSPLSIRSTAPSAASAWSWARPASGSAARSSTIPAKPAALILASRSRTRQAIECLVPVVARTPLHPAVAPAQVSRVHEHPHRRVERFAVEWRHLRELRVWQLIDHRVRRQQALDALHERAVAVERGRESRDTGTCSGSLIHERKDERGQRRRRTSRETRICPSRPTARSMAATTAAIEKNATKTLMRLSARNCGVTSRATSAPDTARYAEQHGDEVAACKRPQSGGCGQDAIAGQQVKQQEHEPRRTDQSERRELILVVRLRARYTSARKTRALRTCGWPTAAAGESGGANTVSLSPSDRAATDRFAPSAAR